MPNRIIRESCRTSETLEQLSGDGERLFWRLVTVADDFGRFEADPRVIRSACFPLRDTLKTATVERWFGELVAAGVVIPYSADGKRLAFFSTWDKYQQKRARNSKFADPPADASTCAQAQADSFETRDTRSETREARNTGNGSSASNGNGSGESQSPEGPATPNCPTPELLAEAWNRVGVPLGLRAVRDLTPTRREKARTRLREQPAWEFWDEAFRHLPLAAFALGQNDRGWKADFDWFIENDRNVVKLVEGKYDHGQRSATR